jgi:hypothetical protein
LIGPNIKEEEPKPPAEVDARNLELQRTTATTVPEVTREKVQCEKCARSGDTASSLLIADTID